MSGHTRKSVFLGITNAALMAALVSVGGGSTKFIILAAAAVLAGTLLGTAVNNWLERNDIAPME